MTSLVSGEHWEQLFSLHFALIYPFQIGPLKHGTAVIERNSDIIFSSPSPSQLFAPSKYLGSLILLKSYFSLTIMAPLFDEHVSGNFADLVKF